MKGLISVLFAVICWANSAEAQNWPQSVLGPSSKSNPQITPNKKFPKLIALKTIKEIEDYARSGYLQPIPDGISGVTVDETLDEKRRYCLQSAIEFIELVGQIVDDKFRKQIIVSSCIRDVKTQKRIRKQTGRGASAQKTTYLTGSAVDISRRNLSLKEERFLESLFSSCVKEGSLQKAIKEGRKNTWDAHYHLEISPEFFYCGNSLFYRSDVRFALERYL